MYKTSGSRDLGGWGDNHPTWTPLRVPLDSKRKNLLKTIYTSLDLKTKTCIACWCPMADVFEILLCRTVVYDGWCSSSDALSSYSEGCQSSREANVDVSLNPAFLYARRKS
uniref:Uncharacterized protein n=1 Tax=Timema bartmani TaxID=61472 RepID=A0A7R9EUQ4_9NEOP|nr:unnamed protein product [Timema bartmani]